MCLVIEGSSNKTIANKLHIADTTVKIHLRRILKKTAARTVDDLWDAIAQGIDTFTPTECENYFAAAGYDRE